MPNREILFGEAVVANKLIPRKKLQSFERHFPLKSIYVLMPTTFLIKSSKMYISSIVKDLNDNKI